MKKCIVISDSFKGSLPSRDICAIARERIPLYLPRLRGPRAERGGRRRGDGGLLPRLLRRRARARLRRAEPLRRADRRGLRPAAGRHGSRRDGCGQRDSRSLPDAKIPASPRPTASDSSSPTRSRAARGASCSASAAAPRTTAAAAAPRHWASASRTRAAGPSFPSGATLDRIAHIDASAVRERLHGVRRDRACATSPIPCTAIAARHTSSRRRRARTRPPWASWTVSSARWTRPSAAS